MKGMIVNLVVGIGLFAGVLVGGLAATGRLNRDGVVNIPVLNGLFPASPAEEGADPNADPHAADSPAPGTDPANTDPANTDPANTDSAGYGEPAPAHGDSHGGMPADAGHAESGGAHPQGQGQEPKASTPLKRGRSIFEEEPVDDGHGGGHADDGGGHGGDEHSAEVDQSAAASHGTDNHATDDHAATGRDTHAAERDFDQLADELTGDRKSRYAPGGYFRFDGMPSGITPEQLNSAWKRVEEVMGDLEKRGQSLALREKALSEFADDIGRRQTELGKERTEVENLQRRLDERIDQFQEQVKMVRTDEVAGLKRNAQTLASFEPSKAAELITEQWKLEAGQDQVLKTLEFMDKDSINSILQALPNAMIRDVMQKRLKVSKEPLPSASGPR